MAKIKACPNCGYELTRHLQQLTSRKDTQGLPSTYKASDAALYTCNNCYRQKRAYFFLFFPNNSIWCKNRTGTTNWFRFNKWKPPKPTPIMFFGGKLYKYIVRKEQ